MPLQQQNKQQLEKYITTTMTTRGTKMQKQPTLLDQGIHLCQRL